MKDTLELYEKKSVTLAKELKETLEAIGFAKDTKFVFDEESSEIMADIIMHVTRIIGTMSIIDNKLKRLREMISKIEEA